MDSHAHVPHEVDEDFEMVDTPISVSLTSEGTLEGTTPIAACSASNPPVKHVFNECHDPECSFSHSTPEIERASERAIEPLLLSIQSNADELSKKGPVFHARLPNPSNNRHFIFSAWCRGFDEGYRKLVKCDTCKHFFRAYGDLCVVGEDGSLDSLFWPKNAAGVPAFYKTPVLNILSLFEGQTVTNEFQIDFKKGDSRLGNPISGGWAHMSVNLPHVRIRREGVTDTQDTMTSYEMLDRIVNDYSIEIVQRAHHMIQENELPYATSHRPTISWLRDTMTELATKAPTDSNMRKNLFAKYACQAYPGCLSSLRGGVVGCLLESIKDGYDFETLNGKWEAKANPLSYLRPTAAPSTGNVEHAEKIFAKLGYSLNDLTRAYLSRDQIPSPTLLWTSPSDGLSSKAPATTSPQLIFSHLLPNPAPITHTDISKKWNKISFRNFALRVLPNAISIDLHLPPFS